MIRPTRESFIHGVYGFSQASFPAHAREPWPKTQQTAVGVAVLPSSPSTPG